MSPGGKCSRDQQVRQQREISSISDTVSPENARPGPRNYTGGPVGCTAESSISCDEQIAPPPFPNTHKVKERDFPQQYRLTKQQYVDEDTRALTIRYFYYPLLGAPFNHCALSLTTAATKRIWYQSLARIKKLPLWGASPNTFTDFPPTTWPSKEVDASSTSSSLTARVSQEIGSSPATRLPQDVVGVIVAHLTHDTHSPLACSLTSQSWHTAAVPHLHHTLISYVRYHSTGKNTDWPKSLETASKFGWLPFITSLSLFGDGYGLWRFSSERFNYRTQLNFSALTNVRELYIANLDIPSFIPTIQQYFGQFSPTVRSLTLIGPNGSYQQIAFFIGQFQHLENLCLNDGRSCFFGGPGYDLTPVPPFIPPLNGCLTAGSLEGHGLAKAMVDLFGGLWFRRMSLLRVGGAQSLLYACASALEALWLDATDLCGEELRSKDTRVRANDFTGGLSHRDLDLSGNVSLQRIEITAKFFISVLRDRAPGTVPSTFRVIMSTIKSPSFTTRATSTMLHTPGRHELSWAMNPHGTTSNSKCSGRCTKLGTFGWFCGRFVWVMFRCESWSGRWRRKRRRGGYPRNCW